MSPNRRLTGRRSTRSGTRAHSDAACWHGFAERGMIEGRCYDDQFKFVTFEETLIMIPRPKSSPPPLLTQHPNRKTPAALSGFFFLFFFFFKARFPPHTSRASRQPSRSVTRVGVTLRLHLYFLCSLFFCSPTFFHPPTLARLSATSGLIHVF